MCLIFIRVVLFFSFKYLQLFLIRQSASHGTSSSVRTFAVWFIVIYFPTKFTIYRNLRSFTRVLKEQGTIFFKL